MMVERQQTHARRPRHVRGFLTKLVGIVGRWLHFTRGFGRGRCATALSAMPFAVAFDTPSRREYNGGMKTKTSITLSEDVVKAMDKLLGQYKNRSEFIELALRNYIAQLIRKERNARDLEIINQCADRLNEEALDVLAYQVVW
jgi:Arc/MetJ-type ribon-helix-helix transcriptional regulator